MVFESCNIMIYPCIILTDFTECKIQLVTPISLQPHLGLSQFLPLASYFQIAYLVYSLFTITLAIIEFIQQQKILFLHVSTFITNDQYTEWEVSLCISSKLSAFFCLCVKSRQLAYGCTIVRFFDIGAVITYFKDFFSQTIGEKVNKFLTNAFLPLNFNLSKLRLSLL